MVIKRGLVPLHVDGLHRECAPHARVVIDVLDHSVFIAIFKANAGVPLEGQAVHSGDHGLFHAIERANDFAGAAIIQDINFHHRGFPPSFDV